MSAANRGCGQNLCSGTIIDGNSYGTRIPAINSGCGLWIPKKYLEEIGFPYDEDHIYSMEEQDILFKRLKEKYPEKYPLDLVTSGNTFSAYTYFSFYGQFQCGAYESRYYHECSYQLFTGNYK